ncbi:MAG: hypothetical protein LUB62_04145 [Prevotellaceae bacterium]|nr:hypothetical protein [Prevotellaceae bacterium]
MKNRTLTLLAACLMGVSAFAEWTGDAPTLPDAAGSTVVDGHHYQIMTASTEGSITGQYFQGGVAWYTWSTSLIIGDRGNAITYLLTASTDTTYTDKTVWTLTNISSGLYTFVSGSISGFGEPYDGLGELHVDMGTQGHQYFEIDKASDTPTYQISLASSDTLYTNHYSGCLGVMPNAESYGVAVYAFLDPTVEDNYCEWIFVDMTVYDARLDLYNALVESNDYPNIDGNVVSAANTVYLNDNATVDELEAQVENLKEARNASIYDGASMDDPKDVTILIDNYDFADGTINGWTNSFVSGTTAQNCGFQNNNSYTNPDVTYINHDGEEVNPSINYFIEAWEPSNSYGDTSVGASIGNAELSQTIYDAPAGSYRLSCDAIASQQYETVDSQHGVQLFATDAAGNDFYQELSTGNGIPEHESLFFYTSGGTLTIGLRTVSTNCNWMAGDNFELLYYGNEAGVYYIELYNAITSAEETYPDLNEVYADAAVKSTFEEALSSAQSALNGSDDEMEAAATALNEAASALASSVEEYATVATYIEYILSVESQAQEKGWDDLASELADYRAETIEEGYYDGTLTSETIAEMEDIVSNIIADYISENCQAGDDISLIINNNDFDTDFSGWTVDPDGATPAWGGSTSLQNENTLEGGTLVSDINSGCAEVYWAAFDISQTLKNLPEGLYTLSCQAFERDDASNGIDAELYAVVAGVEQSQKIIDILDEAQEEPLYSCGEWYDDAEQDDGTYIPNGMNGADVWFYLGHYYNNFNFVVTERGDVTIGIRNTNATDWVLFDTFRLVYQGNTADVYTDYLEELIGEAQAIPDEYELTLDAVQQLDDAVNQAYDALDGDDADACIAAALALQEAIAYAKTVGDSISDLQYLYDYTTETRMAEDAVDDASDYYDTYLDLLGTVGDALDNEEVPSVEQAEQWMVDLKSGYNKLIMSSATGASEDEPADVTAVIINPNYNVGEEASDYGWTEDATVGLSYDAAEIYDQDVDASLSQIIYSLSAGYYRLHVNGFYRPGMAAQTVDIADCDSLIALNGADFYAGEQTTRLTNILTDGPAYSELQGETTETTYYLPYNMEQAGDAFDYDLYQNTLQFQVAEDDTDVEIGVVKTAHVTYDWTIFGRWTLEYLGTEEPSEDATTAIAEVDGADAPVAVAIFTVDGKQTSSLTKGINIVKTTMADGTVKVSKVLVK